MSNFSSQAGVLSNWLQGWLVAGRTGALAISDKGASNLASVGFLLFLAGRFTGAMLLKKIAAHRTLGIYAAANVATTLLVFLKLGWLSVLCVFLSYFFMSIMFPTIFALGIFGLGHRPNGRRLTSLWQLWAAPCFQSSWDMSRTGMTCPGDSPCRCFASLLWLCMDSAGLS